MSDIVEALTEVVGRAAVSTGDAIHDDYTHDEALTATAQRPLAVVRPANDRRGRARRRARGRGRRAAHGARLGHRPVGRVHPGRRRHRRVVRAHERDPRDRPRQPRRGRAARRHPRPARRGHPAARSRVPGVPRRELGEPRRQRRDQRGRHARGEVRRDAPPGARPRSGARHRRGDPHRRQVREGDDRLRPHAAHRRLRGNARARDRGDAAAVSRGPRTRRPCSRRSPRSTT